MTSKLSLILLLIGFIIVAVCVYFAGQLVLSGSPLLALGVVSIILAAIFVFIGYSKRFNTNE